MRSYHDHREDKLPVTRNLTLAYWLSLAIALLMAIAAAAGLLYPARLYPTQELREAFVANDAVIVAIGLPFLTGALALARRGRLIGLLLWPGVLFYEVYNTIAYTFSLPPTVGFLLALVLLTLSLYTLIGLVATVDGRAVQQRLLGVVPERLAGGVLLGLGAAFLLRALALLTQPLVGQKAVSGVDLAVLVADLLTAPALIVGGVLLWRRRALGYVTGAGLLFQASLLFVGLIAFLLLQPLITDAPFSLVDTVVVLAMSLVCFVPTGLFLRGIVSTE